MQGTAVKASSHSPLCSKKHVAITTNERTQSQNEILEAHAVDWGFFTDYGFFPAASPHAVVQRDTRLSKQWAIRLQNVPENRSFLELIIW